MTESFRGNVGTSAEHEEGQAGDGRYCALFIGVGTSRRYPFALCHWTRFEALVCLTRNHTLGFASGSVRVLDSARAADLRTSLLQFQLQPARCFLALPREAFFGVRETCFQFHIRLAAIYIKTVQAYSFMVACEYSSSFPLGWCCHPLSRALFFGGLPMC